MLVTLKEFVVSTQEYRGWGWNAMTVSFVATLFLTIFFQARGLHDQVRTIWRNRSGDGVDVLTFVVSAAYFAVLIIYGFSIRSVTVLFNGFVLFPLYLPILVGLAKFKGFSALEWATTAVFLAVVMASAVLPWKGLFFLAVSFVVLAALALQPLAMWRTKNAANVSIRFAIGFLVASSFWIVYGLAIRDALIAGVSIVAASLYGLIGLLWIRYRKSAAPKTGDERR